MGLTASFNFDGLRRKRPSVAAVIAILFAGAWANHAQAQSTYTYNGANFTTNEAFSTCEAGNCTNFPGGLSINGSFQTAAPLASNLSSVDVASLITGFNFGDGLTTYQAADPQSYILQATVSTNGGGAITTATISIIRDQTATPTAFAGAEPFSDPNSKADSILIALSGSRARHNSTCATRGPSGLGRPNACLTRPAGDDAGQSVVTSFVAGAWTSPPPVIATPVPTMTEWSLILFGTLLAGGTALSLIRRSNAGVLG